MGGVAVTTVYLLDEYQKLAARTSNADLSYQRLAVSALGLVGEAAEATEMVKKHIGHGHALDKEKLTAELGDVMWYVADLCTLLGIDMSDVATANIEKLKKRYPEGFSPERSQNR
jgi:NTP pyrophosphatase (non-canonical NTP hydrolase)